MNRRSARSAASRASRPLSERPVLLASLVVLTAFLIAGTNLARAPDTLYDEAVYTKAAQNVATTAHLTWSGEPLFIHPPLYFLVQGAWLRLTGYADNGLFEAVHAAREITTAFTALNVGLMTLLVLELTPAAGSRRRLLLALAVALIAAFDPVLLRYGRLAMIESMAVFMSLLTMYIGWRWRERGTARWIVVGLLGGLALLVKEISIFLIAVPFFFALIQRRWQLAGRALGALAVAAALWSSFAVWSIALGEAGRFRDVKLLTLQRLLGTLQTTGWNRPAVSFLDGLTHSAPQYVSSYLVLAAGGVVLVWLWLRRGDEVGSFLLAWLLSTYVFGAYTIVKGQLNEQFFAYLMPGAIIATVIAADAAVAHTVRLALHDGRRPLLRVPHATVVPVALIALLLVLGSVNWWRLYYAGSDRGIEQMTAYVSEIGPRCTALNASGDVQKYAFALSGHPITNFGSGPLAASRGVRYFFFNPKDVFARYGKMTPDLAAWLRRSGRRIAIYPSHTYWSVQLWRVEPDPFDPIADIQPIPGGVFVNVRGSACGGYRVVDGPGGAFVHEYQALGGKPLLGRPQSRTWRRRGRTFQAFDTLVMGSVARRHALPAVRPIALVSVLARRAPKLLTANGLPLPTISAAPRTWSAARSLLNDPAIAKRYLDRPPAAATEKTWMQARDRWGSPVGRARRVGTRFIRQPFERVVLERRIDDPHHRVRLSQGLGRAALAAGLVPASARKLLPVPNLEKRAPPHLPSQIRPFLIVFASFLVVIVGGAAGSVAYGRRSRRRGRIARRIEAAAGDPGRQAQLTVRPRPRMGRPS